MNSQQTLYDLVIIGGGISCAHALASVLRDSDAPAKLRIAVVEKDRQFWRGFPYGDRSSPNSLIITALNEFVPDEEHDDFIHWLAWNRPQWTKKLLNEGGDVARIWLRDNETAIQRGEWDEIYIPRRLYGDFIEERMNRLLEDARRDGTAQIDLLNATVERLDRENAAFRLSLSDGARLQARVVLLAIGSPPCQAINGSDTIGSAGLYINNPYLPGLDENLERVRNTFARLPAERRNLLIVGSNATSLELLYMIERDPRLKEALVRIVVMSRGGLFPHRMTRDRFRKHEFLRMRQLLSATHVSGKDILRAAEADIEDLLSNSTEIGDHFHHLSELLVSLLQKMGPDSEREFHHRYGIHFTRLVRRAGSEYRDAVDALEKSGKLLIVRGSCARVGGNPERDAILAHVGRDSAAEPYSIPFAAVVNCAGFEAVSAESSSPLLAQIIAANLARPNETGRGLEVDERFSATPGLYVTGPLLAGVFNDNAKFWHVENVRRIHDISTLLGKEIASVLGSKEARPIKMHQTQEEGRIRSVGGSAA